MTVITYPRGIYQNFPIEAADYKPSRFVINAISLGTETTVTTDEDHNYVVGQLISLRIPEGYGSRQLNGKYGYVTSIPATTQVVVDIDSTNSDTFVNLGTGTFAQIVAVGDINNGSINANGNIVADVNIPGSFKNISP